MSMRTRLLVLLSLFALPAFGQISVGIKAGVPVTDAFETATVPAVSYFSEAKRYTVGPTIELHLRHRVSIEVDALYKRFDYRSLSSSLLGAVTSAKTESNSWEFPLLVKYRFKGKPLVHPFLDAGVSFHHVSGLTHFTSTIITATPSVVTGQTSPSELKNAFNGGFVIGGGIDLKALVVHIQPELRYTRWGSDNFEATTSPSALSTNRNQVEFLVGFNF